MDKEKFFVDKYATCLDCRKEFLIPKEDQEFLSGLVKNQTPKLDRDGNIILDEFGNPLIMREYKLPMRCFSCRKKRKAYFEGLKKID